MELFNPNVIGRQATPEGHVGQNAHVFIPFGGIVGGYWFASGLELTFLTGEIRQRSSSIINGLSRPNSFRKDASSCNGAPTAV